VVRVEGLKVSLQRRGGSAVVTVSGELDIVSSRQLDEYLRQARKGHDLIVLDLAAVDFMDTSSLAVIVGHWKQVVATGGTLALAGPRYRHTKTLWITGLADRLPLYPGVEEALAALGPAPADETAPAGEPGTEAAAEG
jgi:anti-anti-sigma factor